MTRALCVSILLACGTGPANNASPQVEAIVGTQLLRAGCAEVSRIALSCQPDDLAELVIVAGDDQIGSDASWLHDLRCYALEQLRDPRPRPHLRAPAVIAHTASRFAQPDARDALIRMLADDRADCTGERPSRADIAADLLRGFPDATFRETLEHTAARDEASGQASRSRAALAMLERDAKARAAIGPRAEAIDEMIAPSTPAAFDRLVLFLAAGSPWNDGRSPPDAAEEKGIEDHVVQAIDWLSLLAYKPGHPEPVPLRDWDCERDMRQALATGSLGQDLLAHFEQLPTFVRRELFDRVFASISRRPQGFDVWIENVARVDPDREIRSEAAQLARR
ncbi:MAG TPA: hypothetical protein VGG74_22780 [Kofleriaceae bacterium]|jgi:hypothetical protein